MAVVPVVLGVATAYFLRQVYMLALATFSPVMLLGGFVSDRRHGRKSHARQQAEYTERRGPAGVRHARLGRNLARPWRGVRRHPRQHQPADRAADEADAAESADVIDAPDAAHIARATPGRGYVGSATPRWCRSRPAGSAGANPARRSPPAPGYGRRPGPT